MPRRPLKDWIAEQDRFAQLRHADFRRAAESVARAFAAFSEVRKIQLFGSVAQPLKTRTTRRGWEMLHNCKDVDLAVWIDRLDNLAALGTARGSAVRTLFSEHGVGVAHHEVDVFLFEPGSDRYLGRLCAFSTCPKGKLECLVPGCGVHALLRQHEAFVLDPGALAEDRIVRLFDRADANAGRS
jgi:hypothetical protein